MVLEEASSPTEPTTSYTDIQPTSDLDPYSTTNNINASSEYIQIQQPDPPGGEPLTINLANLPKPFSILPFVEAQHTRNIANGIYATCTYAAKVLQRPLRQEEADAFAFHWAKSMRMASYGTPVGVSVAMLWAYRVGRVDMRFPGWKPFKEGSKLSPEVLGPLRGSAARAGWQFLRYNAYGAVGMVFGQLFFASYALTVHAASRALDPRLKEFTEALKMRQKEGLNRAKEIQQQRQQQMGEGRESRQGETWEMARQRRGVMQQQQRGRQRGGDDDMSPTGGSFADDFMDQGGDTGVMSDVQSREQAYRSESATGSRYDMASSRNTTEEFETSPTITRDTPPSSSYSTAQNQPTQQSPQTQQQSSKPAGGAWERLRQSAMSGQPANPSPRASVRSAPASISASSNRNDGFTFSQNEEDRQLARSEAQKEFDARIEREREGKDFGDGR